MTTNVSARKGTAPRIALPNQQLLGVSGFGQFWVREIGMKKLLV